MRELALGGNWQLGGCSSGASSRGSSASSGKHHAAQPLPPRGLAARLGKTMVKDDPWSSNAMKQILSLGSSERGKSKLNPFRLGRSRFLLLGEPTMVKDPTSTTVLHCTQHKHPTSTKATRNYKTRHDNATVAANLWKCSTPQFHDNTLT